jgi:hypothetical protein
MTRDYVLDQGFAEERKRLSGMDRGAKVTAIDIDTRFIESLASDSIEVRRRPPHRRTAAG